MHTLSSSISTEAIAFLQIDLQKKYIVIKYVYRCIECHGICLQKKYIVIKYVYSGYRVSSNRPTEDVHCN